MAETAERAPITGDEQVAQPPPSELVARALRNINIAQVLVASGTISSLQLGSVQLGQATIDRLVIREVTTGIHSGKAFFEHVRTVIRIQVIVDWWYDILFSSGEGRETFTSPLIPLEVGNLLVPSLQDINLSVPEVAVEDAQAQLTPLANLDLGGARFEGVEVKVTTLPADGFDVSGLDVGSLTLSQVGIPATSTQSVNLAKFQPNGNVTLPELEVIGIKVPDARAPAITSTSPVNIFGLQPEKPYPIGGLDAGVFGFSIAVKPFIDLQIGVLTLHDVSLNVAIGSLRLQGVTTPVTVQNIALGDVRLQRLTVNEISI